MHAEICPVCEGKGKVYDVWEPGGTAPPTHTCHGCGGLGWVTVGVEPNPYWKYIPYAPYNPIYDPTYTPWSGVGTSGFLPVCESNMKDLSPEFSNAVDKNFWNLT